LLIISRFNNHTILYVGRWRVGLALAIALESRWVCAAMASAKSVGENSSWLPCGGSTVSPFLTALQ